MQAWYLIYSKPRQERLALENLARQGYEAYVPMMRNRRRRTGRRITVVEPMFPRYLFVHLNDQTDDWGPIRSTIGVVRLVRFGSSPAIVPDDLVQTLRTQQDESGLQVLPEREYHAGERVRISGGLMAGYEAIFQARSGKERVLLLLDIAGKAAKVQVDADDIEPASSQR